MTAGNLTVRICRDTKHRTCVELRLIFIITKTSLSYIQYNFLGSHQGVLLFEIFRTTVLRCQWSRAVVCETHFLGFA